jgi:hypothetical protein
MLIDYIRQIYASQKFSIEDDFKFIEFDDITPEGISEKEPTPEAIEIWAAVKISFKGELPESYKVLNLMIGDWVAKKETDLTKTIHKNLAEHFKENYPDSDASSIENSEDSSIWLDQLDYMPRTDVNDKSIIIEIELVLDTEPIDEDQNE